MPADAYVRLLNAAGTTKAIFTGSGRSSPLPADGVDNGFLYLSWLKKRNDIDYCEFALNYNNPDLALFTDGDQVEVWRSYKDIGLAEYRSFIGIYRDIEISASDDGILRATIRAYGLNSLLARRINAYPAAKNITTSFESVPAENIFKQLVQNNCTALATVANGRDRTAAVLMTFSASAGLGNLLSFSCSRDNLLDTFQKYAGRAANGDFAVIKTGASTFSFEFYVNQLGTNRTATMIFSLDRANMRNPKLTLTRSAERTVAIVGGAGEKSSRIIRIITGPNYTATYDPEVLVDQSNVQSTTQLDSIGASELANMRTIPVLAYEIIQTATYAIERDYFLGDRVRAIFAGFDFTQIIDEVAFVYEDGAERVSVGTVNAW